MHIEYWWESLNESDQDVGGQIILNCILGREREEGVV
jgi:hypothetical protein